MRSHAKASSAGTTQRQAKGLGRFFRGADAGRAPSLGANGSGAPSVAPPAPRARLVFAAAFAAALLALVIASPALAAGPETIAEEGSAAGQVKLPRSVAVDPSSGELYVADRSNFRVSKFDSAGDFLLAWGYGVADGATPELQTCGPEASPPAPRCFKGNNGSQSVPADDLAVDPSSHDVYVAEGRRVTRFTASGEFVFTLGKNVNQTKVGEGATQEEKDFCSASSGDTCVGGATGGLAGEFQNAGALNFDSEGKLWVTDGGSRLQRFEADGSFLEEVSLPSGTQGGALGIDPSSGDFYVLGPAGQNEQQRIEFPSEGVGGFNPVYYKGEYELSFEGETVGPFYAAVDTGGAIVEERAQEVQEALEGLPAIGAGNVVVEAIFGNNYSVTFVNDLRGRDVPQLEATTLSGFKPVTTNTQTQGHSGEVRKLEPSGALIETIDSALGSFPRALTVDSAGNLYVGDANTPYRFLVFNSSGEQQSQFGAGQVSAGAPYSGPQGDGLAVDETGGYLYAGNGKDETVKRYALPEPGPLPENQRVEELLPTTATLAAELNPEGHETTYHFEWGTSESYGESGPTETLAGEEFDSEAVSEELEELIPSTTYHFRLCATNSNGTVCGSDTAFTTEPAVAIDAQWASEVAAHSAKLNAQLNPHGIAGHWWVEYGTSAAYGSETIHQNLPASFGDIPVSATPTGLAANTTYHYRFVATDVRDGTPYTVHGADLSFTTGVSGLGFSLPDNRAWEMVTPPKKYAGLVYLPERIGGGVFEATAGGEAITYISLNPIEAEPESNRVIEFANALARRGPGGEWANKDMTPPHTEPSAAILSGGEYLAFSEDLSLAVLKQRDNTLLSPEASGKTMYLRRNTEPPSYTPLVTAKEGFNNVPLGTGFFPEVGSLEFSGATPDLSHILLWASEPLAEGISGSALYEWTAGRLTPVSVKPEGEGGAVVSGGLGKATRNPISDDGSRVFWTAGSALYVRDLAREETAKLNVVQPGAYGTGGSNPVFQGANAAGTVAFFTDTQNLTADANENGRDLYRCEVTVEEGELGCELTDLTASTANPGESAEVEAVAGVGGDATRLYFTAKGVLDGTPNGQGESAAPGGRNLYLWSQGAGIRFIATLAGEDVIGEKENTSDASPAGRYFAFMSQRSLTGYDNRDAVSGKADQEVFRYDAQADSLLCASCNPSGGAPDGREGEGERTAVDPQGVWDGRWLAASLPEATHVAGGAGYRPRAMHDDGRVFFNAADSLVPADSNGNWDVYQYEPTELGSCSPASGGAASSRSTGGCVSLLSSGTDDEESAFIDAGEGGHDVFLLTYAQLSVNDEDQDADIYDARVDGVPATRVPRSECLGEACQPAPEVPNDKTPASATFEGQGNLVYRPDCGAIARRTGRLSHRARRLRSYAKRSHNPRAKRRMARKSRRLAQRAQSLGKRAKRCRRANRRAGR